MRRYIIKNNAPVPPPDHGVTVRGKVVSNFAERVRRDARFAAENGYYPLAPVPPREDLLEDEEPIGEGTFVLRDGAWVFEQK